MVVVVGAVVVVGGVEVVVVGMDVVDGSTRETVAVDGTVPSAEPPVDDEHPASPITPITTDEMSTADQREDGRIIGSGSDGRATMDFDAGAGRIVPLFIEPLLTKPLFTGPRLLTPRAGLARPANG